MNPTTDIMEESNMTNEQDRRKELLARLDELDRISENTNDPETLKYIGERKKAIRSILDGQT